MAHPKQRLIDDLVGDEKAETDHSLQKQALERATSDAPPTTLTAWEWQQYYAEHGVPESHRAAKPKTHSSSWWRRLLGLSD